MRKGGHFVLNNFDRKGGYNMARNKQNLKQQLITRLESQRAIGQKKEKEQIKYES